MNIAGLSAYYHESSACLLKDGELVAAASEERFSRVKHDARLPVQAFAWCLRSAGLDITDIDCVAYYELPVRKLARQLWAGSAPAASHGLAWLDPGRPAREIREVLGFEGRLEQFPHHRSHAASAFYYSGFADAAILTVDGVGEWATTTYGWGRDTAIEQLEEVEFPDSLGLLYSAITSYLGFAVNSGEYKVMGLAPYGTPRFVDRIRQLLKPASNGQFSLDLEYFDFISGSRMYSGRLAELLEQPAREPESPITPFHQDVARSVQLVLEEVLLAKVRYLATRVASPRLCMAGGVALNCVANGRILREGPFEHLFIQPAAGDAGGCLGAAALAHVELTGRRHTDAPMRHAFLGPACSTAAVRQILEGCAIEARDFSGDEAALVDAVVDRLIDGEAVAWFDGAMEFGPRALGARSILADPRDPEMRDRLNRVVKKREAFRPFAPSVLAEDAAAHFQLESASPFMLLTCPVISPLALPAITHVDGSARPQTVDARDAPRFAALLRRFRDRTGCPVLVNTSFNVRDEPIVCSPVDALACLVESSLDALVLGDVLIDARDISPALRALLQQRKSDVDRESDGEPMSTLYTFI